MYTRCTCMYTTYTPKHTSYPPIYIPYTPYIHLTYTTTYTTTCGRYSPNHVDYGAVSMAIQKTGAAISPANPL